MKSGKIINFPYLDFGMFQNIFFHMPKKCLYCRDHTAETSDISFGDLWLNEFKKNTIKHSCIISRRKNITNILRSMEEKQVITINRLAFKKVIKAQKRPLIYHKFTTSALKKIMLGGSNNCKFNWNDYIAALCILFNMNISEKRISKIIYKLPKKLIFLYMIFIRIFLSF
jgi:coenzyme F420-reducing hydrogenase beta subunit